MVIRHVNPLDVDETIIEIQGLSRPVTLVQITDSHLAEADERDRDALEAARTTASHFRIHSPTGASTRQHLQEILDHCLTLKADCLVLTGDIIHFPTWANVEALASDLSAVSIPFLYTPGNHDWHYPQQPWSERTRQEYYERLSPLTCGGPSQQAYDVHGVKLIGIDNSMYQTSPEQLEFVRQHLADRSPCLLFMHIPMYVPTLMEDVMQRWKAPIMMGSPGWTPETRAKWMVRDTLPSTTEFQALVADGPAENLAGIFCGHIHITHADAYREGRYQYSPKPGYQGGFRLIRLEPTA